MSGGPDVLDLVGDFARRLWAGEDPDPDGLVLDHPHLAADLERRLAAIAALYALSRDAPPVGRYRACWPVGEGASAVVYRAVDTAADREVALKLFHPGSASGNGAARFRRDADALARLKHPNVVRLLDAGVDGGRPYLAMELIDGGSLEDRLRRGPAVNPAEAADLVAKLADALHYAHTQGVVHRDVKPSNVLIGPDGEPQLTDFGLALAAGRTTRTLGPTCTGWGRCCTGCWPGECRSRTPTRSGYCGVSPRIRPSGPPASTLSCHPGWRRSV